MSHQTTGIQQAVEHHCIGHKEGDWVIFTCPICRDYQRLINCKTKQVIVRKGKSNAVHTGSHSPMEINLDSFSNS
ncbi:MAG: hypothetical protein IPN76_32275 [Saprospiraceae bacterium]|nr:hypothetical protein [Saprospiraceae bacterium]